MRTWHFANFYFFYFATVGIIMPYWSVYLDYLKFSALEIGQLMAIFLFTKMLAPNIWATIADKVTARTGSSLGILKFATLATVLIYLFMNVVEGFWPVAIVMLGYCIFWNASLPQLEAATLNHLADKQQYGKVRLWGSLGFIFTVMIVGGLMDFTGPQAILPAGAIALMALFFASLFMQSKKTNTVDVPQPAAPTKVPVSELLNPKVLVLLLLCLLMQISHSPLHTFMSIYLSDYGYSRFEIGVLWSVGVVFEILIFIGAATILKKWRLSTLLTFTFFVAATRWFLVGFFPDFVFIVFITQAMHAITFGLYHAVMIQLIDQLFVGHYQVRGQALYSSVTFGLGGAIGSYASGYIWQEFGKQQLFLAAGFLMLSVFVLSIFVTPKLTENSRP